jgi:hypothetical protein
MPTTLSVQVSGSISNNFATTYELTIEFFLPLALLLYDVDRWFTDDAWGNLVPRSAACR